MGEPISRSGAHPPQAGLGSLNVTCGDSAAVVLSELVIVVPAIPSGPQIMDSRFATGSDARRESGSTPAGGDVGSGECAPADCCRRRFTAGRTRAPTRLAERKASDFGCASRRASAPRRPSAARPWRKRIWRPRYFCSCPSQRLPARRLSWAEQAINGPRRRLPLQRRRSGGPPSNERRHVAVLLLVLRRRPKPSTLNDTIG